jgi:F-type H+-transporting ATPase subunit delta
MTQSALASRYAAALVDVVTGTRAGLPPDQVTGELRAFEDVLRQSAELRHALASPSVSPARKRGVVGKIAERLGASRVVRNFLFVLIDHRRVPMLSEIIEAFITRLDERLGFARAEVRAARQIDDSQRAALVAQLERLTGKQVRLQFTVDESLIGGVVARVGSTVYDGSVRGRLETLGRRMTAE